MESRDLGGEPLGDHAPVRDDGGREAYTKQRPFPDMNYHHYYRHPISLWDKAASPSDVRIYDGEGTLKRVIPFRSLLRRKDVDYFRDYPQRRVPPRKKKKIV